MSTVFVVLGFGLSVLLGLAAVSAYLRGTAVKADLQRLRDSNNDLRSELVDKERRIDALEVKQAHIEETNDRMSAALARIGEQAASGAEIRDLADALRAAAQLAREQDLEAATRHAGIIRALRDVRAEQAAVKAALDERKRLDDTALETRKP